MINIPRFMMVKMFAGGLATYHVSKRIVVPAMRYATGWEDSDSEEWNQKQVDVFIKKHENNKIIELKEGENYF